MFDFAIKLSQFIGDPKGLPTIAQFPTTELTGRLGFSNSEPESDNLVGLVFGVPSKLSSLK